MTSASEFAATPYDSCEIEGVRELLGTPESRMGTPLETAWIICHKLLATVDNGAPLPCAGENGEAEYHQVTMGDRNRLARDRWETDGKPERCEWEEPDIDLSTYEDEIHTALQAMIDAGWKVEVPVGWRTRESGS